MPSLLYLMIDTIYAGFEVFHYLTSVISWSTWNGRAILTYMSTFPISWYRAKHFWGAWRISQRLICWQKSFLSWWRELQMFNMHVILCDPAWILLVDRGRGGERTWSKIYCIKCFQLKPHSFWSHSLVKMPPEIRKAGRAHWAEQLGWTGTFWPSSCYHVFQARSSDQGCSPWQPLVIEAPPRCHCLLPTGFFVGSIQITYVFLERDIILQWIYSREIKNSLFYIEITSTHPKQECIYRTSMSSISMREVRRKP